MSLKLTTAFFMLLLFSINVSKAQPAPTLPEIEAITKNGINLLRWVNPYTNGVQSVSIQRSSDSVADFGTIGLFEDVKNPNQAFIDSRPQLGKNWYHVVVLFTSGASWVSNNVLLKLDSSQIASRKPLPLNDSLQKIVAKLPTIAPEKVVEDVNQQAAYPKSKYVYTDQFNGNIDISLPDADANDYKLSFYNQSGQEVLTIPRINDTAVILDKRNFQTTGLFHFKLLKNKEKFAEGTVTIY